MFSDQVKYGPDADDGHDDGVRALDPSGFASSAIRCFVRELIQIFFALDVNKISFIYPLYPNEIIHKNIHKNYIQFILWLFNLAIENHHFNR